MTGDWAIYIPYRSRYKIPDKTLLIPQCTSYITK